MVVMDDGTRRFLSGLSPVLGWIYMLAWSVSFYPQPLLNWQRRSTVGSSIDFPFFNVIGFSCYVISNGCFLYSPYIRTQYAVRHPASPEPTNRLNDFVFGLHAVVLVVICYSQYFKGLWGFEVPASQRVSRPIKIVAAGCAILVIVVICVMLAHNGFSHQDARTWAWIDVIYAIGGVKLIATVAKYTPQAVMNYRRKSTVGWAIETILLDLIGSIFSFAQLIIDSSLQNDWSGLTGNPVKLGLSNISLIFDLIFMFQHYILYRHNRTDSPRKHEGEHAPLLQQP